MDATQAMLLIILAVICRDGLLAWLLINIARGGHATVPTPAPAPGPAPDAGTAGPAPVVPAAPAKPRFTGITATSFGGPGDANSSAYGGMVDPAIPGVALPFHFTGARPKVRVFLGGKTVDCAIVDVGPWNINDPYWTTGARPQAESGTDTSGRSTNLAGIDLTPAAWAALGYPMPNSAKAKVDWDFVDTLASPAPPPSIAPAGIPPWLATMRGLIGTHAGGDNPKIMDMPKLIGNAFPEMAAYAAGYTHDSIAWCGLSAAYCMAEVGIRPPFGATDTDKFLWAYAWANWGTPVASDDDVQPGDVIVWTWASGDHHVTLYDHAVPTDDNFWCCGGNQGAAHTVTVEPIAMSNRHVIRRAG